MGGIDEDATEDEDVLGPETPSETTVEIGEDFEVAELPVQRDSDVAGATLAESDIRERTGANVIGAWVRGEFRSPPPPELELDSGTVLLVAGHEDEIDDLKQLTSTQARKPWRGSVVVVGYGEVVTAVGPEFRLRRGDHLIVAGTDEDVNRFTTLAN